MLLSVDLDEERFVVDVGFGSRSPALRLEPDTEQATPHEPFRLVSTGEEFVVQARIRTSWESLYRFDLSCVAF
jgi:N-hydroxyarylamine O-acetyltransferase